MWQTLAQGPGRHIRICTDHWTEASSRCRRPVPLVAASANLLQPADEPSPSVRARQYGSTIKQGEGASRAHSQSMQSFSHHPPRSMALPFQGTTPTKGSQIQIHDQRRRPIAVSLGPQLASHVPILSKTSGDEVVVGEHKRSVEYAVAQLPLGVDNLVALVRFATAEGSQQTLPNITSLVGHSLCSKPFNKALYSLQKSVLPQGFHTPHHTHPAKGVSLTNSEVPAHALKTPTTPALFVPGRPNALQREELLHILTCAQDTHVLHSFAAEGLCWFIVCLAFC